MRSLVFVLALLGAAHQATAAVDDWLAYTLKSLATARSVSLAQYRGKPVLMSFFEPECPWCFRQLQDLQVLHASCPDSFQPLALGVNGERRDLRQIFARTRASFPAYIASPRMLADIGGVPATPITVLVDASGAAVGAVRGYRSLDELGELLAVVDPQAFGDCR